MSTVTMLIGDVFESLATLKAEGTQVDLVMTSPPFLALRSYLPPGHPNKGKEIGSEPTPAEFLTTMLDVVEACADVLAPHGSICFEFGDTYSGASANGRYPNGRGMDSLGASASKSGPGWPLDKSLCMIPELFAASLAYGRNLLDPNRTADPWRIRNTVAWVRPNPPVGALGDKVRPAKSLLTWATKARDRWFDLDAVRTDPTSGEAGAPTGGSRRNGGFRGVTDGGVDHPVTVSHPAGTPPLDWWKINPGGYSGSHYAVYPPELCRIPIEASCPRRVCTTCGTPSRREAETTETSRVGGNNTKGRDDLQHRFAERTTTTTTTTGWTTCGCPGTDGIQLDGYHTGPGWRPGIVLDPFGGSGTTGLVATGLSRAAILVDLDERNLDLARERIGMFLEERRDEPAGPSLPKPAPSSLSGDSERSGDDSEEVST